MVVGLTSLVACQGKSSSFPLGSLHPSCSSQNCALYRLWEAVSRAFAKGSVFSYRLKMSTFDLAAVGVWGPSGASTVGCVSRMALIGARDNSRYHVGIPT